ncbi:MAG TPA: C-GCAxxG-C-C family protein [Terriglobales bacterium]|nr:C-GCAxxG-C-C family protein [Terriglobales bacterium]
MNDSAFRIFELHTQGFGCSQILMQMALEEQGKSDPDLVRAMTGLLRGMNCGKNCGALTGACCVLGLYAGRGAKDEQDDPNLNLMLHQLVEWFEGEYKSRYGSIDCAGITGDDPKLQLTRCPQIVAETFNKVTEILTSSHYDLSRGRTACAQGHS